MNNVKSTSCMLKGLIVLFKQCLTFSTFHCYFLYYYPKTLGLCQNAAAASELPPLHAAGRSARRPWSMRLSGSRIHAAALQAESGNACKVDSASFHSFSHAVNSMHGAVWLGLKCTDLSAGAEAARQIAGRGPRWRATKDSNVNGLCREQILVIESTLLPEKNAYGKVYNQFRQFYSVNPL